MVNGLDNNLDKLTSIRNMKQNFFTNRNMNNNINSNNSSNDMFKIGAQKNRELNKRMDELSINGGISSGSLARNNIIKSSSSFVEGALPVVSSSETDYSSNFNPETEDDPIIHNTYTGYNNYYDMNRSNGIGSNFTFNNNNRN